MTKVFCLAPWVHSFVAPKGQRALCCYAEPFENSEENFDSYWNSQILKDIRKLMLKGSAPKEYCNACLKSGQTLFSPKTSYDFARSDEELIKEETKEDGHTTILPRSLDYRMRNTCNLSCRMCHPDFSSKIEKAHLEINEKGGSDYRALKEDSSAHQEFLTLIEEMPIKWCYFAGGESLMQKGHFEELERLAKKPCRLSYNTNLAYPIDLLFKKRELYQKFTSVELAVSIDGVGETGEFLRDGLKWHQFYQNVTLINNDPLFEISRFDITLTLPTLLDLKPLALFLIEQGKPFNVSRLILGGYATFLSLSILPKVKQSSLIKNAIEELQEIDKDFFSSLISFLKDIELKEVSLEDEFNQFKYGVKLDKAFQRADLLSYYEKFEDLKEVSEILRGLVEKDLKESLGDEQLYWNNLLQERKIEKAILHRPLNESEKDQVVIASYPSLLSRLLNRDGPSKYENFHFLKDKARIELLPPFHYLFKKKPTLGLILDTLTRPLRPLFALHFIYFPKKR